MKNSVLQSKFEPAARAYGLIFELAYPKGQQERCLYIAFKQTIESQGQSPWSFWF